MDIFISKAKQSKAKQRITLWYLTVKQGARPAYLGWALRAQSENLI